jgi:hypothetical protein
MPARHPLQAAATAQEAHDLKDAEAMSDPESE